MEIVLYAIVLGEQNIDCACRQGEDWQSWNRVGAKQNAYNNLYSQAVTHPSTNRSQPCLTSVIRRELVYSR